MSYTPKNGASTHTYICGIDPDCTASGFSCWEWKTRRPKTLATLSQPDLQTEALTYRPDQILFVVEAGWRNPGIWHGKNTAGWDGNKAKAYGAAIGKSVGANHEVGRSIIHFLQTSGFTVLEYVPRGPKWNAAIFKKITGLPKGYNPEIRDSTRAISKYIF